MTTALLLWALVSVHSVPPQHAIGCVGAALLYNEAPETLCAYLVSEHPGSRYSGRCSSEGACGPYQLSAGWVAYAGYAWADGDPREHWWASACIAAAVMQYSKVRHARCRGSHDWRAHLKCGPGSRDRCGWHVRRWKSLEKTLTGRGLTGQNAG